MQRCIGIMGWISGHQFAKTIGERVYERDNCWRCGMNRKSNA